MAGIDEVLERLVTDPEFRARLAANPVAALSGYMLYDEDLEVLAATLSEDRGASGAVEQRTSKTTLAGLLAAFEGSQALPDGHEDEIEIHTVDYDLGRSGGFDGKLLRAEDLTSESGSAD